MLTDDCNAVADHSLCDAAGRPQAIGGREGCGTAASERAGRKGRRKRAGTRVLMAGRAEARAVP